MLSPETDTALRWLARILAALAILAALIWVFNNVSLGDDDSEPRGTEIINGVYAKVSTDCQSVDIIMTDEAKAGDIWVTTTQVEDGVPISADELVEEVTRKYKVTPSRFEVGKYTSNGTITVHFDGDMPAERIALMGDLFGTNGCPGTGYGFTGINDAGIPTILGKMDGSVLVQALDDEGVQFAGDREITGEELAGHCHFSVTVAGNKGIYPGSVGVDDHVYNFCSLRGGDANPDSGLDDPDVVDSSNPFDDNNASEREQGAAMPTETRSMRCEGGNTHTFSIDEGTPALWVYPIGAVEHLHYYTNRGGLVMKDNGDPFMLSWPTREWPAYVDVWTWTDQARGLERHLCTIQVVRG